VNALPPLPPLTHPDYSAAFNQVKSFGDINSINRSTHMEETGLFWAYDHPALGPPPVLFIRNIKEIAEQIGSGEADNARLFAQASVAQADAAIAAWDAKFRNHFWRPIGAIQGDRLDGTKGHDDGNPNTAEDALSLLVNGRVDLTPLRTHRFALADFATALETFERRRDGAVKVAI